MKSLWLFVHIFGSHFLKMWGYRRWVLYATITISWSTCLKENCWLKWFITNHIWPLNKWAVQNVVHKQLWTNFVEQRNAVTRLLVPLIFYCFISDPTIFFLNFDWQKKKFSSTFLDSTLESKWLPVGITWSRINSWHKIGQIWHICNPWKTIKLEVVYLIFHHPLAWKICFISCECYDNIWTRLSLKFFHPSFCSAKCILVCYVIHNNSSLCTSVVHWS